MISDEDREFVRELHGLLKDGGQLERQIREGRAQLAKDVASVTAGMAAAYIKQLDKHLKRYILELSDTVDDANASILEHATKAANMKTTEEFLAAVIYGLRPVVVKVVKEYLDISAAEALKLLAHERQTSEQPPEPPTTAVITTVPSPFRQRPGNRHNHGKVGK